MELRIFQVILKLRNPFRISRYVIDEQPAMIVALGKDGYWGFGEATQNRYYRKDVHEMVQRVGKIRNEIRDYHFSTPELMWEDFSSLTDACSFTQCALDEAANDLYGKIKGQRLFEMWGGDDKDLPLSNFSIGIGSVQEMSDRIRELPWPVYKIKLGTEDDLTLVESLRKVTDIPFRIDANSAWDVDKTLYMAEKLAGLNVQFIEQPLQAGDWEGMRKLKQSGTALPIIADESFMRLEDLVLCEEVFDGINIKLMKCGGLTPARKIVEEARKTKLQIMCGCMTESSVGISAMAQLLPFVDIVDMDGAMLLKEDIAEGVRLDYGKAIFPLQNGTGVTLNSDRLEEFSF